jgi:hypothetical protein
VPKKLIWELSSRDKGVPRSGSNALISAEVLLAIVIRLSDSNDKKRQPYRLSDMPKEE